MLSFLADELVWAAIREREDEARGVHPHTTGWPRTERSMEPPKPLGGWLRSFADNRPGRRNTRRLTLRYRVDLKSIYTSH